MDIRVTLKHSMDARDVGFYSHRTIVSPDATIHHSTIPENWIAYYESEGYFRFNPGIHKVKTATGPISM